MSTPLVPTIPSAKATLSASDTAEVLAAVFGVSPLPLEKNSANVRQIVITVIKPTAPLTAATATISVSFNP